MTEDRSSDLLIQGRKRAGMQRGFNLIELMIGIAIVSMVLFFGIPSFGAWLQSSQIRNAAESIQNGLQLTRAEAVSRNTSVQFVLSSLAAGGVGSDWVVSCVTPSATCPGAGQARTEIQKRSAQEGSVNAQVEAEQSTIVFNGMGRVKPIPADDDVEIEITNPTGGTCAANGGAMRCLKIVVTGGGHVHMCDPALPSTSPRGC